MKARLQRRFSSPDQGRLSRNSQGKKFHPFNTIELRTIKRQVSNSNVTIAEDSLLYDGSCDSSLRNSSRSTTPVASGLKTREINGKSRRHRSSRKVFRKLRSVFNKQKRNENNDYVSSLGAIMSQKDDLQKDDDSRSNHTRDTDLSSMSTLTSVHASTIMPEKEGSPPFVVLPLPLMMMRVSSTLYSISDREDEDEDENTNFINEEEKPSEIMKPELMTESMTEDGNSQQHCKSRTSKANSGKKKKRRSTLSKKKSRRSMRMNRPKSSLFCSLTSSVLAEQIYEENKSLTGLDIDFLKRNNIVNDSNRDALFNILAVSTDNRIAIADGYYDSSSSSDDEGNSDGLEKRSIYYQATEESVCDISETQESITEQTLRSSPVLRTFGNDDILSLDVGNDFNPIADWGLLKCFYRKAIMKSFKDQTVSRKCVNIENLGSNKATTKVDALNENLKEQEDEINALKEIKSDRETLNTKIKMELSTLDNNINRVQTKLIDGKYDLIQAKANEDLISLQVSDVITHHDRKVDYLRDKVQGMYASIQDLEEEIKTREEDIKTREEETA